MTRNLFIKILLVSALVFGASNGFSQSTFQNLNFESAFGLPPANGPVMVPATNAFPGWLVYDASGSPASQVFYDGVSAGTALTSLVGTNTHLGSLPIPALVGNYSAAIASGETSTGLGAAAIAQTGTVPANARSLTFIAAFQIPELQVTFAGQNIPFILLASGGPNGSELYGGDISAFAGQLGELRFTENVLPNPEYLVVIDNISFSPQSIPEPTVWTILLCGGALTFASRRKSKS